MDFPRLRALNAYWEKSPPTHIWTARIASFIGVRVEKAGSGEGPASGSVSPQQETSAIIDMLTGTAPATESHG